MIAIVSEVEAPDTTVEKLFTFYVGEKENSL